MLLSAAAAVIGSLVLYNLKTLKCYIDKLDKRMDKFDNRIERIETEHKRLAARKEACQIEFVSAENWIRSESFTRRKLDHIAESVGNLAGSLKVIEQMPLPGSLGLLASTKII